MELWERSLERSRYRRQQAAIGRKEVARKKSASVAMSAAMLGGTAAPSVAAAQSGPGGGSTTAAEVQPTALEDPGSSILLKLGDSGPSVAAVQRELAIQVDPAVAVDGLFGPQTQAAVIEFQQREGLRVDGVVGPETWDALFDNRNVAFVPTQQPQTQVAASYERPKPPTRAASDGSRKVGAQDFNGGNYLVMVENRRSSGHSAGGGTSAGGGGGGGGGGGSFAGGGHAGGVTVCGLSKLKTPVRGPITGRFGEDRGTHAHAGIDIAAPSGTPVRAAACGKITFAGVQSGYGKMVCIQHTPKFETCYAHLSSIRFKSGYVRTGQVIGRVGCTGTCTGPHVHFETRVRGKPKDPMLYLRGKKKVPGKNKRYERQQRQKQRERERRAAEREAQERNETTVQTQTTGTETQSGSSGTTSESSTQTAPAYTEPAPEESTVVEPAVEPAPVEPPPVEPTPVEPAPVEPAPVEPAPVTETVQAAPVETPAPVEPAPVTETVQAAPVETPAPVEPVPVPETTPAAPGAATAAPELPEQASPVAEAAVEQSGAVAPEQTGAEVVTAP